MNFVYLMLAFQFHGITFIYMYHHVIFTLKLYFPQQDPEYAQIVEIISIQMSLQTEQKIIVTLICYNFFIIKTHDNYD